MTIREDLGTQAKPSWPDYAKAFGANFVTGFAVVPLAVPVFGGDYIQRFAYRLMRDEPSKLGDALFTVGGKVVEAAAPALAGVLDWEAKHNLPLDVQRRPLTHCFGKAASTAGVLSFMAVAWNGAVLLISAAADAPKSPEQLPDQPHAYHSVTLTPVC